MRIEPLLGRSAPDTGLAGHVSTWVWGPAEFIGLPSRRLVGKGVLTGLLGAGGIVGAGALGMWTGPTALGSGEAGLVIACVLGVRLAAIRAGRAFVGLALTLGICLALTAPQATAGLVLAHRGRIQEARVTSVEVQSVPQQSRGGHRYFCSVENRDGTPLRARIWRGCRTSTEPGDALAVLYDPLGRVPPRGAEGVHTGLWPLGGVVSLAGALVVVCAVAVIRSFRLTLSS
ncbi:hypothetical protein [Streptomyces alboflavus]|uniref:hypothetical protein n=1 Tax=Streptomyces alboflavus TaxID=67267 RepID=UPI000B427281|nr:hypothetical protein [Streptomyces alboflavus]